MLVPIEIANRYSSQRHNTSTDARSSDEPPGRFGTVLSHTVQRHCLLSSMCKVARVNPDGFRWIHPSYASDIPLEPAQSSKVSNESTRYLVVRSVEEVSTLHSNFGLGEVNCASLKFPPPIVTFTPLFGFPLLGTSQAQ